MRTHNDPLVIRATEKPKVVKKKGKKGRSRSGVSLEDLNQAASPKSGPGSPKSPKKGAPAAAPAAEADVELDEDGNPIEVCTDGPPINDTNLKSFQKCNKTLDQIQKSLEDYLETKRLAFPRFYFLSNDELLEILSQTRDPTAVQPHLGKCFDAMKSVVFGDDEVNHDMTAMTSSEKEVVPFSQTCYAKGPVEEWLTGIETMMRLTLYDLSVACKDSYPSYDDAIDRWKWLNEFPAAMILMISQIFWAINVETVLRECMAGGDENRQGMHKHVQYCVFAYCVCRWPKYGGARGVVWRG